MTLVNLIDPGAADESVRPVLESGRAQYGVVLHTWRALLHRPAIFSAYLPYLRAVAGPGTVEPRVKELAALTVAIGNHCRYTASHRVVAARAAGVADGELDALARGDVAEFPERERLAIRLADQLTRRPPVDDRATSSSAVDAELLASVQASFSEPQIVELVADISLWNALSRFHRVMDLPLDMPAPPDSIERLL